MNRSSLGHRHSGFGILAAALSLAVIVSCSSTSQTNVMASQGGSTGTGGAGTGTTGGGGQTSTVTSGGTGTSNCSAGATLVPDLHAACVEDLGNGRVRLQYDFAGADQGLDWAASTGASIAVNQHALTVASASSDIGVALFRRKLHVDKASFTATLLSGSTFNWYINTLWTGAWDPPAGYSGYHDKTGRGFVINGSDYSPDDVSPLSVGVSHTITVEQSNTELRWEQDGTAISADVSPLPVTDRNLALGAWDSSAAFYDVVIEGTLD